jgi:4-hydroxy-2-oxoheptanedioate aldolase
MATPALATPVKNVRRLTLQCVLMRTAIIFGLGLLVTTIDIAAFQQARINRTIELLSGARPTFGILSHDRSLENARSLARSALDFVIIDMEHGPLDIESLRMFLLGMTDKERILAKGSLQMDVTPLVRLPANGRDQSTFLTKQALDVGVMGVMFPTINNAAEAELAVRSMRYPQRRDAPDRHPAGLRGSGPGIPDWYWGVRNYQDVADVWPLDPRGELISIIQIESEDGVRNVDAIASVPGVTALFIGPADLALSLGYPNDAPEVEAAIQTVLRAARSRKLAIGITATAETVERRLREGFTMVTVGFGDGGITPESARALAIGRKVQF